LARSGPAHGRAGEILYPDAQPMLVQLGLWQGFLDDDPRPNHGFWSAWGSPQVLARDLILNAHGPAWNIDRRRFDRLLMAACSRCGVRVEESLERVVLNRDRQGWTIDAWRGKSTISVKAGLIVDATGRAAAVARQCGARRVHLDRMVAFTGVLRSALHPAVADDVLLVEAAPDGWWYSSHAPDGRLVAAYLTDADLARRQRRSPRTVWSQALAASNLTAARVGDLVLSDLQVRTAASSHLERSCGSDWIAVGDAAGTIDPLSGIGIARALRSGIQAAQVIEGLRAGQPSVAARYRALIAAEFEAHRRAGALYYQAEKRWPTSEFWRRRQPQQAAPLH
jgi:flavin-dependent dehydrogenase